MILKIIQQNLINSRDKIQVKITFQMQIKFNKKKSHSDKPTNLVINKINMKNGEILLKKK